MVDSAADTAAGEQQWCWATQAGDALVAMQRLVADAGEADAETIEAAALGRQVQLYRSAAQIGLTQTAARSTPLMRKHHALARRLLDRQDDYLRFATDRRISADNNGTTRHPHGQTEAEDLRLPAHPHRSPVQAPGLRDSRPGR